MKVIGFKPFERGTMRGFVDVQTHSGMVFRGLIYHERDGDGWVSLPGRPMLDRDGVALRDAENKIRYAPLVEFADTKLRRKFSDAAVHAVALYRGAA